MTDQLNKDITSGKFLPNNRWRYKSGQSGRIAKFNYRSLRNAIVAYTAQQVETDKRFTWAGLARHMGITRHGLDAYRKGEVGTDNKGMTAMLDYYVTLMEEQLEERLDDRRYATQGVLAAVRAIDPDKWGDHKKLDIAVQAQMSVVLPTGGKLKQRMIDAGVTIDQTD